MAWMVPPEIVTRFRAVAQQRLDRIDTAWQQLRLQPDDAATAKQLRRELHTCKGDAHLIGFRDVSTLCHKLEELVAAAERQQFRVGDDFDIIVTMATRFLRMLVRSKPGGPMPGIDLPAFLAQIDTVMVQADHEEVTDPFLRVEPQPAASTDRDALSARTRGRLASAATEVFVEAIGAEGASRRRLLAIWTSLAGELDRMGSVRLDLVLVRHAQSAKLLAADLGKSVEIQYEVGSDAVGAHLLEALDDALIHALRNAVDHGMEAPPARRAAGKRERGTLTIRSTVTPDVVEIMVADDGAGIDLDEVRRLAVARELVAPEASLDDDAVIELLFTPGFSTRARADEISGRGLGLDAIRAALRELGGEVSITAQHGHGTIVTMRVPHQVLTLPVRAFPPDANGVFLAIPADREPGPRALARWGLPYSGTLTGAVAIRLCPTPPDVPVEVVRIDGADGLLVRA